MPTPSRPVCPTCGRVLHAPDPTVPTTVSPYLLPTLPDRFRLPDSGTAVQVVSMIHDDETATTTITVRQLLY